MQLTAIEKLQLCITNLQRDTSGKLVIDRGDEEIIIQSLAELSAPSMKLTPMEPFTPREGERIPFNPFHHDLSAMGTRLSEELYIMQYNFDTDPLRSAYLVNVKTGERNKLTL